VRIVFRRYYGVMVTEEDIRLASRRFCSSKESDLSFISFLVVRLGEAEIETVLVVEDENEPFAPIRNNPERRYGLLEVDYQGFEECSREIIFQRGL
jgi:hypothetical protein